MFMNITGKNAVGVMDRNKSALQASWPLPPGDKLNVAMALDDADHRLFVVTRNPGKLIVLNSDTGKVVTSVPTVGMVADMAYEPKQKRIYVTGGQVVDAFTSEDRGRY